MSVTDANGSVELSRLVLHGSPVPHTTMVICPIKSTHQPLLMLKYCLAAQRLHVQRRQLAQEVWARSIRVPVPAELILLPGIPPPAVAA